jgi:hypothetical protein
VPEASFAPLQRISSADSAGELLLLYIAKSDKRKMIFFSNLLKVMADRNGKLESTKLGKKLTEFSNYVNSWFENKVFIILCVTYFICAYGLYILEPRDITVPDNKSEYTIKELAEFISKISYRRNDYLLFLFLETIVAFTTSVLGSFTVSLFSFTLVSAEEDMEKSLDDRKVFFQRHQYPFRAIVLNLLPLVFFLFELLENIMLAISLFTDQTYLMASLLTFGKWRFMRGAASFIFIVYIFGWIRVFYHRLTSPNPKPEKSTANLTGKGRRGKPPPGLTKANMISEETWSKIK